MKYFLDSGKLNEIVYAYEKWGINGVTTNPKHIYATGKPFRSVVKELADQFKDVDFPISIEVNPHLQKAHEITAEALSIARIAENFVIKVPCTEQGLIAGKILQEKGINVNVTLVFSASQAIQAGRIGAKFVSPFIAWKEASGEDCKKLLKDIVTIYGNYRYETEIIVAAIRNGKQIVDAAVLGADIVTAGFEVYKDSFYHPFTDYGIKIFADAWDKTETGAG